MAAGNQTYQSPKLGQGGASGRDVTESQYECPWPDHAGTFFDTYGQWKAHLSSQHGGQEPGTGLGGAYPILEEERLRQEGGSGTGVGGDDGGGLNFEKELIIDGEYDETDPEDSHVWKEYQKSLGEQSGGGAQSLQGGMQNLQAGQVDLGISSSAVGSREELQRMLGS